jgi:hypothetical protein
MLHSHRYIALCAFPMSLLVDATKILEVLADTTIDQACLPCQPACLVLYPLLSPLLKWIICELICLEVIYFSYMVLTAKFQSRMSCVCFERMYRCTLTVHYSNLILKKFFASFSAVAF